jgi:hypothetical protein
MELPFDRAPLGIPFELVEDLARIESLSPETEAVLARRPSDTILNALVNRLPKLRILLTDATARYVTDRGIDHLLRLQQLVTLELGRSALSDSGLLALAELRSLRRLDVRGAVAVTPAAVTRLRAMRPDLDIVEHD